VPRRADPRSVIAYMHAIPTAPAMSIFMVRISLEG
jgi:hypothetical protein